MKRFSMDGAHGGVTKRDNLLPDPNHLCMGGAFMRRVSDPATGVGGARSVPLAEGALSPDGKNSGVGKCITRRADPESERDRAAIERLWRDNLPYMVSSTAPARFEWLYRSNPDGPTLTWLAVDEQRGEVVGCASVLPRKVVVEGVSRSAGVAIDFAIDKPYRAFGVALRLQRAVAAQVWESGMELVVAFPNDAAQGVIRRVGYRQIGQPWRGAQLLRSYPKLRQRRCSVPLAMVAGAGIDLVLQLRNRISLQSGKREGVHTLLLEEPDERWKRFWDKLKPRMGFGGSRDLDYLRWRYRECPLESYLFFCLFDSREELLGYLVFSRRDDVLHVCDIQSLEGRWMKPLLDRFWSEMRQAGVVAINAGLVGSQAAIERFRQSGFVTRDGDGWGGVLTAPGIHVELAGLLQQEDRMWYLTEAELDL